MATNDLNHNLVLLDILRSILVAVGDAEQIPEESHALFLERFDMTPSFGLTVQKYLLSIFLARSRLLVVFW